MLSLLTLIQQFQVCVCYVGCLLNQCASVLVCALTGFGCLLICTCLHLHQPTLHLLKQLPIRLCTQSHVSQVVLHLITSPSFRANTVTPALLSDLASFLVASSNPTVAASSGVAEFKATLMHVLEAICQVGWCCVRVSECALCGVALFSCFCYAQFKSLTQYSNSLMHTQQTELVLQHHAAMLGQFLPALCATVSSPHESGDTRFFCLRMVSEVRV